MWNGKQWVDQKSSEVVTQRGSKEEITQTTRWRHIFGQTEAWNRLDVKSQEQKPVESIGGGLCQKGDYYLGINNKLSEISTFYWLWNKDYFYIF